MIYRLVPYYTAFGFFWTLLAFLNMLTIRHEIIHLSPIILYALVSIGIFTGIVISFSNNRIVLNGIEKKGLYSQSLFHFLLTLGILLILFGLFFYLTVQYATLLQGLPIVLFFLYPMPAVVCLTSALTYKMWERKNKKVIYLSSGLFVGKIYAYPYIMPNNILPPPPPPPMAQTF